MREPDHTSSSVRPDADPEWTAFTRAVGQNLLAQRLARGLTQQQAAELVGIQPESVSRIENGTIVPTLLRLRQFSRVYDCGLADLLERASNHPGDLAMRIAHEISELDERDRRFVTSQLSALIRHLREADGEAPGQTRSARHYRILEPSANRQRSPKSGR